MKKIFFVLAFCMFLISGCFGTTLFSSLGGVEVEFLEDTPPITLNIEEEFGVSLKLTNSAGFDINNGKVCIDDLSADDGIDKSCKFFDLSGADKLNKQTKLRGYEIVDFDTDYVYRSAMGEQGLSFPENVIASLEYPCSLKIRPKVCIKYDMEVSDCAKSETLSGKELNGEAGPVTVTKIKKVLLKKAEEGVVLSLDIYFNKLNHGNLKNNELDIEVVYDGIPLQCEGSKGLEEGSDWGEVTYTWEGENTEKVIKCKKLVDYTEGESYEANLDINLDYTYEDRYSKLITVKNPIGGDNT